MNEYDDYDDYDDYDAGLAKPQKWGWSMLILNMMLLPWSTGLALKKWFYNFLAKNDSK